MKLSQLPSGPARKGAVILPFCRPRVVQSDADRNAEWDRLVRLAVEAWTWRDPDSLDTLGRALTSMRAQIGREWSA